MRYLSFFLTIILILFVLDVGISNPEFIEKISSGGIEHADYFEQTKYKFYENEEEHEYSEIKFKLTENLSNYGEVKFFYSTVSYNDAYQKGNGNRFINGTEIAKGKYYFVIEVKNFDESKYILIKELNINHGYDKTVEIDFDDSITNYELLGININSKPRNTNFLSHHNLTLDGLILTLHYDKMSIDINNKDLDKYGIHAFLVKDENIDVLEYNELLTMDYAGYNLYLADDNFNNSVNVMPLQIDSNIRNYSKYGQFFTEDSRLDKIIKDEAKSSFEFFWENRNMDANSKGYGLVPVTINQGVPSEESGILTTGGSMVATIIAMENKWISEQEGYKYITELLNTIDEMDSFLGFYYDKFDIYTGEPLEYSEISVTHTSVFLASLLTVGEYFGGHIEETCNRIYNKAKWYAFYSDDKLNVMYNNYTPDGGYDRILDKYEEQLIAYFLMAGNPSMKFSKDAYDSFERTFANNFYYTWNGGIHGHLIAQTYVDFRNIKDAEGINWFENTVIALENSKKFTDDLSYRYDTYKVGWGLGASDTLKGYRTDLGTAPSGYANTLHKYDGSVPTYSAITSIVFNPKVSAETMYEYDEMLNLRGKYGFYSAFSIQDDWVSLKYRGREKGETISMLANYKSNMIWNLFMETDVAKQAVKSLAFEEDTETKEYEKYYDPTTKLYYNAGFGGNKINNIKNVENPKDFYVNVFE